MNCKVIGVLILDMILGHSYTYPAYFSYAGILIKDFVGKSHLLHCFFAYSR